MGVEVDHPGHDDAAGNIPLLRRRAVERAEGRDLPAGEGDIRYPVMPGVWVEHAAIAQDQIVLHRHLLNGVRA